MWLNSHYTCQHTPLREKCSLRSQQWKMTTFQSSTITWVHFSTLNCKNVLIWDLLLLKLEQPTFPTHPTLVLAWCGWHMCHCWQPTPRQHPHTYLQGPKAHIKTLEETKIEWPMKEPTTSYKVANWFWFPYDAILCPSLSPPVFVCLCVPTMRRSPTTDTRYAIAWPRHLP